jgi:hypothetical protein
MIGGNRHATGPWRQADAPGVRPTGPRAAGCGFNDATGAAASFSAPAGMALSLHAAVRVEAHDRKLAPRLARAATPIEIIIWIADAWALKSPYASGSSLHNQYS